MTQRARKEYSIDPTPYLDLIEDAMISFGYDPHYAENIARTATTIKAKRVNWKGRQPRATMKK